jgi:phage FluMu gp28-like protein
MQQQPTMKTMISTKRRIHLAQILFGWRPHETQNLWLLDDSRVKVAACGRRWGKTEAAAIDAAMFAAVVPDSVQMIVSPTYDQSRLIFDTVERILMKNNITRQLTKVTKTPYPRLQLRSSLIMARTADEDGRNLRGHSADRVIIDEAAYVKDAVVEEVIGPMLADRDGQLVMISTPFGKNHFYRAFMQGITSQPHYASFRFPSWENPHISQDYIEFQRNVVTPRQFAVEYEAEFLDDQSSVFSWDTIQTAIALGKTAVASKEPWIVAGVDWARYSDYTTVIVMDARSGPSKIIAMDRFNRLSWEAQVERVAAFLEHYQVNAVLTDQTSIGDPLLEQLRNRLWERGTEMSIDGFTFTNSSKRELIDHLVIKLANRELGIPDDEQLVRELQYFEYELTTAGNVRMNARSGYTDDLVIALALAAWKGKGCSTSAQFLSSSRQQGSLE